MKIELERAVAMQGMQENWILAIMPKYGNSAPDPQKMIFGGTEVFNLGMERSISSFACIMNPFQPWECNIYIL